MRRLSHYFEAEKSKHNDVTAETQSTQRKATAKELTQSAQRKTEGTENLGLVDFRGR
jgi:hypothetical protein